MIVRRWSYVLFATVFLVWMADWLFYRRQAGWSLSLFLGAAFLAVALKGGAHLRSLPAAASAAVLLGLLAAFSIQPGPLVLLMVLAALGAFAIIVREGSSFDSLVLTGRLLMFAVKSPFRALLDALLLFRVFRRRSHPLSRERLAGSLRNWTLPLAGSLFFLGMFRFANPVISQELDSWRKWLESLLVRFHLDPERCFLWGLFGAGAWALLRVRSLVAQKKDSAQALSAVMSVGRAALLLRCLALFNAVFAVQTLLDLAYLLGGIRLPDGMTYAEYAHRGAYPLVATALLAAAFVLIAYRPGPPTRETATVRRLVLLWLAQNIFLTFTAAWRLHIYTNIYSLTRLRLAAGIWMFLVALGLVWIALRIAGGRSNRWLVNKNLITTGIVLYLCCFVNFDGIIAWHNVRHCREAGGEGTFLDYSYMMQLGPEAIPALKWARERGFYSQKSDVLGILRSRVTARMTNWRSWTYRSWVLWEGSLE